MHIEAFHVEPSLPPSIGGLAELAANCFWSWDEDIRRLFMRLDPDLWNSTSHNPVRMLGLLSQETLDKRADDDGFVSALQHNLERFRSYMGDKTWWERRYEQSPRIAYFSAEFGITECLPIYSGGLGVLAGDHLKSASDLGVPLYGVGLLYQQGYFQQYLSPDGWQQESYAQNDFYTLPLIRVSTKEGEPLTITMDLAGEPAKIAVWRADVGRVPLFLLDTNLERNRKEIQDITDQLYGGGQEMRIRQELVLGVGGLRALYAMGIPPQVCHMNEGHAAFQAIERIRLLRRSGLTFEEAFVVGRAGNVFTTHTPVPAGFDLFPRELVEKYLGGFCQELGISMDRLFSLGCEGGASQAGGFGMAALAARSSTYINGVSKLHGEVSKGLLAKYFPRIPAASMPVSSVTNGIHTRSFVSGEMASLFDRYVGPDWWRHPGMADTWRAIDNIPDEELWRTHERRRERLVAFARRRLMGQLSSRGAAKSEVERARGVLDAGALTIGFARRFATYKRASLILKDRDRLRRILLNEKRPVQLIFAGKAHPRDDAGKEVMKEIVQFSHEADVRRHVIFIEDYNLLVARYLVQGVDVWLNTPRRGLEASGTSGMKVLPNGGLNLSIPDGWWAEGYLPEAGWAIGKGEEYDDLAHQDHVESNALYELIEKDVIPLFYDRGDEGLPRRWIASMKRSMKKLTPAFNTNRMLWEYSEKFYLKAAEGYGKLERNDFARGRVLAEWKARVENEWSAVRVLAVEPTTGDGTRVGEELRIRATLQLAKLTPKDVCVEICYGKLSAENTFIDPSIAAMNLSGEGEGGTVLYEGSIPCTESGRHGYTVRVRPCHRDGGDILLTGLLTDWE